MDVQLFIAVNLMALSAISIAANLLNRPIDSALSWMVANGIVLAAGALALHWQVQWVGMLVSGLYVTLVMAPFVLGILANRAVLGGRMRQAALYGRGAALLHPSQQLRFSAAMAAAQAHPTIADKVAALRLLAGESTLGERVVVMASVLRAEDDWAGLLRHIRAHPVSAMALKSLELRALGELGRRDEMLHVYEAARARLAGPSQLECQLFLMAFCGRSEAVDALLKGPLVGLHADNKAFWSAIAARVGGNRQAESEITLRQLAQSAENHTTRISAARHLATPADRLQEPLSATSIAIAEGVEQAGLNPPPVAKRGLTTTPVTWVLLAMIIVAYVVEERNGGAENLRALADLGAVWPPYVLKRGEWWRLGTALFLHFGLLHVAVNSFMLLVLGSACEQAVGSVRMLIVYALGGLASSGFVLWLMATGVSDYAVLVGASGAIMALFGCLVADRIVAWVRTRDALDGRRVAMLGVVVLVQAAVDLSIPEISIAAHGAGFVAGLLLGLLLVTIRRPDAARA